MPAQVMSRQHRSRSAFFRRPTTSSLAASFQDDLRALVEADVADSGHLPALGAELVQDYWKFRTERFLHVAGHVPHDPTGNVHSIATGQNLILKLVHRASSSGRCELVGWSSACLDVVGTVVGNGYDAVTVWLRFSNTEGA